MDRCWSKVVIAATGPSFSQAQADMIEAARAADRCRVIAISDNWKRLPSADVMYAGDGKWFDSHLRAIRVLGFAGEIWTESERAMVGYVPKLGPPPGRPPLPGLHYIEGKGRPGLTTQPDLIHNGRNSTFAAMNLAYLFGGMRPMQQILVGLDMKKGKPSKEHPRGKQHWFGDHAMPLSNDIPFAVCIANFAVLAVELERAGVTVLNATIDTALTCFKHTTLEQALA